MNDFKSTVSLEKRIEESKRILDKYPERIPVICEQAKGGKLNNLTKFKFLIPKELTMGQFIYVIRKKIKLDSNQAIFLFINNKLIPTAELMSNIYEDEKDEDFFLYISYSAESTFGC